MEVHHHGHKGGSKNWKTYLSEFFMLFLAVFSGFIAENLREHYVEKERGHQYVSSMLNDLGKDTTALQEMIVLNQRHVAGTDSLLSALSAPVSDSSIRKIYGYCGYVISSDVFESANTTISQLKNAGGYRLITDTAIVNCIMTYDKANDDIREQAKVYSDNTVKIIDLISEIMDLSAWKLHAGKNFYFDKDAAKTRLFYNKCFIQQKMIENYIGMMKQQKQQALKNISILSKKS